MYFGSEAPAHPACREMDSPQSAQEARPRALCVLPNVRRPPGAVPEWRRDIGPLGRRDRVPPAPMTGAIGRWNSHCSGSERGQRQCEPDVAGFARLRLSLQLSPFISVHLQEVDGPQAAAGTAVSRSAAQPSSQPLSRRPPRLPPGIPGHATMNCRCDTGPPEVRRPQCPP